MNFPIEYNSGNYIVSNSLAINAIGTRLMFRRCIMLQIS